MSSKKNKKSTLPPPPARPFPRRLVPFRHPDFTDDQIQRLTDDSFMSKERILKTLKKLDSNSGLLAPTSQDSKIGGANRNPLSPGAAPTDGEFISAMMARLVWLETKLSEAHRQLQDKEKNITNLEDQISILNQARSVYDGTPIQELEDTCLRLQNQMFQMERFFSEYGLMWNSDKRFSNSSTSSAESEPLENGTVNKVPSSPGAKDDGSAFKVDYDLVVENIKDLNVLAGEGIPQICLSPEGAKFKLVDHVPLYLFSNGISLSGGPFRPFTDRETKQCLQDLMDGYFPSELQRHYPNGVPLKVIDKRTKEYHERHSLTVSTAKTLPVPGSRSPSLSPVSPHSPTSPLLSGSGASSPCRNPEPPSSPGLPHVTVQELIDALPRSVVRDGRLLDVRNSISQLLKGCGQYLDIILVHTPVIQHIREGRQVKNVTTLRIRSETGNETYMMKLYVSDTIADVRKYLDLFRSATTSSEYEIVALYPRRVFDRLNESLEECGLVPNAALHLRANSQPASLSSVTAQL